MEDYAIIQALECCLIKHDCNDCPIDESKQCDNYLHMEALSLIKRQKKEIKKLKECPKCIYEYDGEKED